MTVPVHYKSGVANRQGIYLGRPWTVPCEAPMGRSRAPLNPRGVDIARKQLPAMFGHVG
jgi:hypothetical protein